MAVPELRHLRELYLQPHHDTPVLVVRHGEAEAKQPPEEKSAGGAVGGHTTSVTFPVSRSCWRKLMHRAKKDVIGDKIRRRTTRKRLPRLWRSQGMPIRSARPMAEKGAITRYMIDILWLQRVFLQGTPQTKLYAFQISKQV